VSSSLNEPVLWAAQLQDIKLLHCRLTLKSCGIRWSDPLFKGNILRNMLDTHLRTLDPLAHGILRKVGPKGGVPYVLSPPIGSDGHYIDGREFHVDLTLVGDEAISHVDACIGAIEKTGLDGVGKKTELGHFSLIKVEAVTPEGNLEIQGAGRHRGIITAEDIAMPWRTRTAHRLLLNFVTPLALQKDGKIILDAQLLTFGILCEKLLSRIARFTCQSEENKHEKVRLMDMAQSIAFDTDSLITVERTRYSENQKSEQKMGGLMGMAICEGELSAFLPYFAVAEYLHHGTSTTFGHGKCLFHIER